MILLWRIGVDTKDYLADDLSGLGAQKTGGRWNSPGRPVMYTSGSIALSALETVVHLDGPPFNRFLVEISVPEEVFAKGEALDPESVVGWNALPAGKTSIDAGDRWLDGMSSPLLRVPSTIVEEEHNFLINPRHPDALQIKARKVRKFLYDPRLL